MVQVQRQDGRWLYVSGLTPRWQRRQCDASSFASEFAAIERLVHLGISLQDVTIVTVDQPRGGWS